MGLFNNYQKEGKGVSKDAPESPFPIRYLKVLTSRFWQLVVLNLLYLFACLPIITIGPATAGFNYVLRNYSQKKPVEILNDFMQKCKENFKQGLIISLIDAVILYFVLYALYIWVYMDMSVPDWLRPIAIFFAFFVLYVFVCANYYIYPMMVSFNLKTKQLIRNSIILGIYKLGKNVLMLVFNAAIFLLLLFTWPASLAFAALLPFSLCGLFNNMIIYPELVRHVAAPSEGPDDEGEEEPIFKDIH